MYNRYYFNHVGIELMSSVADNQTLCALISDIDDNSSVSTVNIDLSKQELRTHIHTQTHTRARARVCVCGTTSKKVIIKNLPSLAPGIIAAGI